MQAAGSSKVDLSNEESDIVATVMPCHCTGNGMSSSDLMAEAPQRGGVWAGHCGVGEVRFWFCLPQQTG